MKLVGSIVGILLAVAAAAFLFVVQPGGSGVVASLRLPDGAEYMVTQRCNWSAEPYTVAFYMRPPDGVWGWCYIDHEAPRWRNVAMIYDERADLIVITERGKLRAKLDRKNGTFWFDNGDGNPRSGSAPQDYRQPEFAFR